MTATPPTAPAPLLLDAAACAALCNVSRATWFSWQASGQIPLPCLSKGYVRRWSVAEIQAWIQAGTPSRDIWETVKGRRRP
jgi:predicted DNA-binding transcriptional regulator AlpA